MSGHTKQRLARPLRSKIDTGIVVVLDKRIATKPYGQQFLNALPPAKIVHVPCKIQTSRG